MRTKTDKIQIEHVEVSKLIPYARNSRTHSPAQVKQIAASIREFGFMNPVLIDADNTIIAGHGRVMAAEHLQLEAVPCVRHDHLTEAQRRAYIIADNRLAINAEWDEDLLKIEIDDLHLDGFDVAVLGFEPDELIKLLGLDDITETELPELPSGEKDPYRTITFKVHETQEQLILEAIQKANELVTLECKYEFTEWLRAQGVTAKQIDQATNSHMGGHYLSQASQPDIPTAEKWAQIKHLISAEPPERIIDLLERRQKEEELNQNRNGNALYKICKAYNGSDEG
jgi:ParB family transcriptional regulator, chromosome partitioning protein